MFTTLARYLATAGHTVIRFDWPGLGDADGAILPFESLPHTLSHVQQQCAEVCTDTKRMVWMGLCDGASVALMHAASQPSPQPDALILLNPWVRNERSQARAVVKHYYRQRLFERSFWRKVISGQIGVAAVSTAWGMLQAGRKAASTPSSFQDQMALGWRQFTGHILLVISGNDLTGQEFLEHARHDPAWRHTLARQELTVHQMPHADHTFSGPENLKTLAGLVLAWLASNG